MGFFSDLFGFEETTYAETRGQLLQMAHFQNISGASYAREQCDFTLSRSGRTVSAGIFSMPSVAELHDQVQRLVLERPSDGIITVQNMVGEARSLHSEAICESNAVVQAASQFNMLEFPSSHVVPEQGISGYINDRTQGPACAVACAAGTAYRNYLVPVPSEANNNTEEDFTFTDEQRGQSRKNQLNGLADMERYLLQEFKLEFSPWKVKNGYIESSPERIEQVNKLLADSPSLADHLMSLLRIGVQEDTTVTDLSSYNRTVTQTYNSAISIGYSLLPGHLWEPVARLVLCATYEATLLVGVLKTLQIQDEGRPLPPILLTKVGGGVFANKDSWILEAIFRAVERVKGYGVDLDVRVVHFGKIDSTYRALEQGFYPAPISDDLGGGEVVVDAVVTAVAGGLDDGEVVINAVVTALGDGLDDSEVD